ncbi:hypothetical protein AO385_0168 [Moraxella catarrhalis]|uniref:Uncharacterized protein n=1 Tax=Moraxella catarrhalis TaxID=480 RepID=A0A198UTU3_MORCA|nr:hypothetical protein AO383_2185 [Moraxella catarrhalis]OAU94753.1 hypothetical protein AO384_2110 [Moraxella catarrhalis]OAU99923.1 hypothetical protein AO382_1718 [Moraxella catarrhalis]OAV04105.1 hypothetical protein AO385_0168 [Moraxella catarrhalis]
MLHKSSVNFFCNRIMNNFYDKFYKNNNVYKSVYSNGFVIKSS